MPRLEHGIKGRHAALFVEPPQQGGQPAPDGHFPDGIRRQVDAHRRLEARSGHAGNPPDVLYAHVRAIVAAHRLQVPLQRILRYLFRDGAGLDGYGPPNAPVRAARVGLVLGGPDKGVVQALHDHVRRDRIPQLSPGHEGARLRRYLCIVLFYNGIL